MPAQKKKQATTTSQKEPVGVCKASAVDTLTSECILATNDYYKLALVASECHVVKTCAQDRTHTRTVLFSSSFLDSGAGLTCRDGSAYVFEVVS